MPTISVSLEEELFRKAEERAAALDTSVPEVVAQYLRDWVADDDRLDQARRSLAARFAQPQRPFSVGTPDDRSQRNACR